jgi:hypothetical protein
MFDRLDGQPYPGRNPVAPASLPPDPLDPAIQPPPRDPDWATKARPVIIPNPEIFKLPDPPPFGFPNPYYPSWPAPRPREWPKPGWPSPK